MATAKEVKHTEFVAAAALERFISNFEIGVSRLATLYIRETNERQENADWWPSCHPTCTKPCRHLQLKWSLLLSGCCLKYDGRELQTHCKHRLAAREKRSKFTKQSGSALAH